MKQVLAREVQTAAATTATTTTTTAADKPFYSYGQIADQLISGAWSGDWHAFNTGPGGTITVNVTALTADGKALALAALGQWSDIIGVNFVAVSSGGQIVFDDSDAGAYSQSSWWNHTISSSTVNIDTAWLADYGTGLDSYSFQTYLHEIGHALGLGHAGNYDGSATFATDALFANDAWATTVMSYFAPYESSYFEPLGFTYNFLVTPMNGDIVAAEQLYGLSTTTRTGDTTYGFNSNANRVVFDASKYPEAAYAVIDSGGTDTLDYSGFADTQLIDLNEEAFSNVGGSVGNVTIAHGTLIENAVGGSGVDVLVGNAAGNVLDGRGGNDTLRGNDGNDRLIGAGGNDLLDGGAGSDTADFGSATGAVTASLSLKTATQGSAVDSLVSIENVAGSNYDDNLSGDGNANAFYGRGGADRISGGAGNDTLDGGTGADSLTGGAGNDVYVVDSASDLIIEAADEGTDLVRSAISLTLRANVENLSLTGSAAINGTGNTLANAITGNDAANLLAGGDGDDILKGGLGNDTLNGGAGIDRMYGGLGDDTYTVGDATDYAYENAGEGVDRVNSSVALTLRANVENLYLTGTAAISGTGNELANIVSGNAAANSLRGAAGDDRLYGNAGNDVVNGEDGNDLLEGGSGTDRFYGGLGADKFVFRPGDFGGVGSAADRIHDFSHADGDRIRLDLVDADTVAAGDQAFAFIGTGAFTGHAGELRFEQISGNTYVQGDLDGDGAADLWIRLDGLHALAASDFIL